MSQREFSEEELRALEAEMERITVDDVLLQTVVSLLNLGGRKAGLGAPPGEGPKPDLEQVRLAIEGTRALLPVLEPRHGDKLGPVRDTLSRLQMIYAQAAGQGSAPPAAAGGGAARPEAGRRRSGAALRPPLGARAVSAGTPSRRLGRYTPAASGGGRPRLPLPPFQRVCRALHPRASAKNLIPARFPCPTS